MNAVGKALTVAGIFAVAAAGGTYYASEFVFPDIIEAKMNAAFDDIHRQSTYFSDLKIEQTGRIQVERANQFLIYKAVMPGMNSVVRNALDIPGADVYVEADQASYILAFDPVETIKAVLGWGDYKAQMRSLDPVGFNAKFFHTESPTDMFGAPSDAPDSIISEGVCGRVEHTVTLGENFSLDSEGSDCAWAADIDDDGDKLEVQSKAGFEFAIAKNGKTGYDGKSRAVFRDLAATAFDEDEAIIGSLTIGKLQLDSAYAGQPASKGKTLADMDLSDLPNDLGMTMDIEGLKIVSEGLPPMPELDFGVGVDLTGIKTDSATAAFRVNYDMTKFSQRAGNAPETSDCTVRFGNIPAKGLAEIVNRHAAAGGDETELLIIEETLNHIITETDFALGLRCEATQKGITSIMKAAHVMKDGTFPGEGSLELRNAQESLQQMMMFAMMFGGPEMAMVIEQIVTAAEQTGENGLKWSYELDEAGALTVNGKPMGVVMPPREAPKGPQP